MGERKTTLFELNVETVNFEFSPDGGLKNLLGEAEETETETDEGTLGLFGSGDSESDDEEPGTEVDIESEEETETDGEELGEEESGSNVGLVIGLIFLVLVATLVKKFVVDAEPEEYEEVELSEYEG